jgi:beta-aspartyl-peptidase (threonine type)
MKDNSSPETSNARRPEMTTMPMSSRSRAIVGLAAVLALFALRNGTGRAEDEGGAAVRRLLERQAGDWNRGDLDAFLDGYARGTDVVYQTGADRFDGFDAIAARYRRTYRAEGRAMGQLEFSGLDVVPLGGDAALARGRWRLTLPDGKRPGGLFTLILRKRPEGWRIVHDHTS